MEDGNQRLTAEEILASIDLLQQVAGLARRVGGLVSGGQQTRPHISAGGDHSLPHRVERHSVNGPQGALGGSVVQAQRLHLVAKELDAYRVLVDRGKDVDDSPAYGEGSGILDYLRPAVAGSAKIFDQCLPIQGGLGLDHPAEIGERHRGNHAAKHRRSGRHHHGRRVAVTQAVQECQPAHDGAAIGLHLGVRRDFGRRQV